MFGIEYGAALPESFLFGIGMSGWASFYFCAAVLIVMFYLSIRIFRSPFGMTTIIVEQNAIAALHLVDRALILDMGQVVFDGTSQEVIDNADLRQRYLAI